MINHLSKADTNFAPRLFAQTLGTTMRITSGLVALTLGLGLPAMAIADDEIASFSARWPQAPMRKPTISELVRLVAGAIKQDVKSARDVEPMARQQRSPPCIGEICQLLNSR